MATQLLIYETAVPVSSSRFGKHSIEIGSDYNFSKNLTSVPLMAVEFPQAAGEYPIVFAGEGDTVMPATLLGIREKENLYLDDKGAWEAKYLPAFIRRYPFVFSSNDDGKTFTLCIDEDFAGLNNEDRGQRLFDEEGKPSEYTDKVLKFLQDFQLHFQRTQAFCKRLHELDVLEPAHAQIKMVSGNRTTVTGFQVINRDKLKKLPAETLAGLAKSDELELIYLHLSSMRNFAALNERLGERLGAETQVA